MIRRRRPALQTHTAPLAYYHDPAHGTPHIVIVAIHHGLMHLSHALFLMLYHTVFPPCTTYRPRCIVPVVNVYNVPRIFTSPPLRCFKSFVVREPDPVFALIGWES